MGFTSHLLFQCSIFSEGTEKFLSAISNSPSTASEGQRQFKLELDLGAKGGEDQKELRKETSVGKDWTTTRYTYQEMDIGKIGSSFWKKDRKLYKLVWKSAKNHSVKGTNGNLSIKKPFDLIGLNWEKGEGPKAGGKVQIKTESVNAENKVWLIIAKGENSIYLLPVVRCSGTGGTDIDGECKNAVAENGVKYQGVEKIGTWSQELDNDKDWGSWRDEEIQKLIKEGFSITRKIDTIFIYGDGYRSGGMDKLDWQKWINKGFDKDGKIREDRKINMGYLYQNAGVLKSRVERAVDVGGDEHKKYFPLDLVVFGNTATMKNVERNHTNLNQEITVTDTISDVIGVRLDQVLIDNEGLSPRKWR